jgi:hypothetical protein
MDSFLFYGDYIKQIQSDNLSQIVGGNFDILNAMQLAAVEECKSYLKQKYDTTETFKPTLQWELTKAYNANQTVYLNAVLYNVTQIYPLNSLTLYNGNVYICSTAITVAEAFDVTKWDLLGKQYDLFYSQYPKPVFNLQSVYAVGDEVFYKNKTYTCKIPTSILDHNAQLQIGVLISPIINIFPNDPIKGVQYWGVGIDYNVSINTIINDTNYWVFGDNRDQKLLMICIDIALYHLHCRISPKNIPDLRLHRYMGDSQDRHGKDQRITYPTYCALGWLQSAATGNDITPELSVIQPTQGGRIRHGGNVKNQNSY